MRNCLHPKSSRSHFQTILILLILGGLSTNVFSQFAFNDPNTLNVSAPLKYYLKDTAAVKTMRFTSVQWYNISSEISEFKNLEKIEISKAWSIEAVADEYSQLPNLKTISIQVFGLEEGDAFPDSILLKLLSNSNIENVYLGFLPSLVIWNSLSKLPQLKTLSFLMQNELGPNLLANCPNLENLRVLAHGQGGRFPLEAYRLPKLKSLHVQGFEILPHGISSLKRLERLVILNSGIQDHIQLPDDFVQLRNLRSLSTFYLDEASLPLVGELPELKEIYLATNARKMPFSWTKLASLERLWFCAPRMDTLPDFVGKWTGLEEFVLKISPINSLPSTISQLKKLKLFSLEGLNPPDSKIGFYFPKNDYWNHYCNIESYCEEQKPHIAQLENGFNSLQNIFEGCNSLETIYIAHSKLADFSPLKSCKRLRALILPHNHIQKFELNKGDFPDLEILDLAENQIVECPKLNLPQHLLWFSLAGNQITSFPELGMLPDSLIEFNLTHNNISELPLFKNQWAGIYQIFLDQNPIRTVPKNYRKISKIKLYLRHTPFSDAMLNSKTKQILEENGGAIVR